ncbi:Concanavalin A-like lectins/glucanase [Glarea lozoyensis ATCC 20868]|uniref:Glucanase n=1 Tax=Glarea lozoyensis (strain ATCC 20868 / MF5171) TaxID=1116229 RepID=S3CP84_GLAL2|nr:Concanavalin A-like lectins/glucanase [Glarea lozoyensis ATCC 20868]EPE27520.1 Concanavalin A-like lectins/glucanase [Glarea lozoyensis ATCC 20868]
MYHSLFLLELIIQQVSGQSFATLQPEVHPLMRWESCSSAGCSKQNGSLVLDAEWRWIHEKNSYTTCFEDGHWLEKGYPNKTLCPDDATCTENCVLEGTEYQSMGIWPKNDAVTLKYYNYLDYSMSKGARLFMLRPDGKQYNLFKLLNKEISFEVDVSKLPCGISADVKFVAMDSNGGFNKFQGNTAGAAYGTGYCDASCPRDLRFINGQANVKNWTETPDSPESTVAQYGFGLRGSCCAQLDVFNGNSISSSFGLHPCNFMTPNQHQCIGDGCNPDVSCDAEGCAFNTYRMGNTDFYGPGGKGVDTTKPFTVVTQFPSTSDTDSGVAFLKEMKRFYIQNGTRFPNGRSKIDEVPGNSITGPLCTKQKEVFSDVNDFDKFEGMSMIGEYLAQGMVMAIGIWDDRKTGMAWLDGKLGEGKGALRGTCPDPAANIHDLLNSLEGRRASVSFGKIRVGEIGTTV